jgi:hypothetical protein
MNTKLVSVMLSGYVRVLYPTVVQVPLDLSEIDMKIVLSQLYELVPGSAYSNSDPVGWKEGEHSWADRSLEQEASWEVRRDMDGVVTVSKLEKKDKE